MTTGRFREVFGASKISIGMVHLLPLIGSPGHEGSLRSVTERAVEEGETIAKAGFDGLIVENYGDLPFHASRVGPETVAAMTVIVREMKRALTIPIGVNVLRNDAEAALAIAAACGCEFIRVNILVGSFVTPEGLIDGNPARVLRLRERIAPKTLIFADAMVKHAYALAPTSIDENALDVAERGRADCVIVTGPRTGSPPSGEDLKSVRARLREAALDVPVMVGSGVAPENAENFFKLSDGIIIGSYIRKNGKAGEDLEIDKVVEIGEIKKRLSA